MVGDFNVWDGRRHPMRLRRECGVWEIFLPGVGAGDALQVRDRSAATARLLPLKADPYALPAELRPATASVVAPLPPPVPPPRRCASAPTRCDAPMSHLRGAPRLVAAPARTATAGSTGTSWPTTLPCPTRADMGFTHLELLPVSEHPFDGSWGYQPLGLYAPTARFGDAGGLRAASSTRCHARRPRRAARLGAGALSRPTRTAWRTSTARALYEYADPREGFHRDWNTLIYNFGRTEVRNFLVGNALYWLERYGVDGLRVDAVASMLYRDYSRKAGEWVPNVHGGRENLEAIAFLKRINEVIGVERPQARHAGRGVHRLSRRVAPDLRRRPGLPLQVEHGLDARHAAVHRRATRSTAATTTAR
ncbi:MAG: hypothetical protein MZV49_21590 [Rhodopseudomonas palustris]|nr:hypothetical protein [Rhodopseudomonas palustris]